LITIRLPRFVFVSALATWALLLAFFLESSFSAEPLSDPEGRQARARIRLPQHEFADVADVRGVPVAVTPTWGSAWADISGDGFPELLVNRHKRSPWMLVNRNGSFGRLTNQLDTIPEGRTEGPNRMLLWNGTDFSDAARDFGVVDPHGRGRTVNWLDFDSDNDLDLFVGNEVRSGHPSKLYRNTGDGFVAVDPGARNDGFGVGGPRRRRRSRSSRAWSRFQRRRLLPQRFGGVR
jgi:hypothetical protein